MIYYDIGTGRFSKDSDILQVAITRGNNTAEEDLNVFALSTKAIGVWAAKRNGLSITYTTSKKALTNRWKEILPTVSPAQVVQQVSAYFVSLCQSSYKLTY